MDAVALEATLKTEMLGHPLRHLSSVPSTQDVVREAARAGAREGLAVVADQQTAGRGRGGRNWWSPPTGGLYLSVLFRPHLAAQHTTWLTMCVALGTAQAIENVCKVRPGLKWPNDLEWQGRKIAGILSDASFRGDRVEYIIVGLGLNVNIDFCAQPDLTNHATSLQSIVGHPLPLEPLLLAVLTQVEDRYLALKQGVSPVSVWAERLTTLGKPVLATTGDGRLLQGIASHVLEDGALCIRLEDGREEIVRAVDVTLRPNRQ